MIRICIGSSASIDDGADITMRQAREYFRRSVRSADRATTCDSTVGSAYCANFSYNTVLSAYCAHRRGRRNIFYYLSEDMVPSS